MFSMKPTFQKRFFSFITLLFLTWSTGCASGAKRIDTQKDLLADTGELTRQELEKAAIKHAAGISEYFEKNPQKEGIFVALLPTKNETSEIIAIEVFDHIMVNQLLEKGIYTVRTEDRSTALSEIEFGQTGMVSNPLSVGKMKSPNYYIKTDILEFTFTSRGKKIVEQSINTELRQVETQLVVWSKREVYRKQAAQNSSVNW